ncbi:GNAT family N-acetyltransferase [Methanosarcina sp. Mfa9]|uniref:GNAT family N-acetyltransferase n=1 Tax=Methanosarcina sp. Mfa9 TaxID=3439063 RepID=UPI003F855BCE
MGIRYSDNKNLEREQLVSLFKSVEWESAKYPQELQLAIANSHSVYTAWDGDKLVGLMNALSDGVMTVYYHYLLVKPEYHKQRIGATLVRMMTDKYSRCRTQVVISYSNQVNFYKNCGFIVGDDEIPLFISDLV